MQSVILFLILLLLLPPNGLLTENEENYFQLAAQATTGAPGGPNSAVFDASSHRYVNELLLGHLIALVGYEATQIITRTLTAAGFALILPLVFRSLTLSALDGAIVLIVFDLLGQTLIGGEWIFNGFESKVVAYGFVLAAIYAARTKHSPGPATVLCVGATYFHFLIGIFWFFAILGLRLTENRSDLGRSVRAAIGFVLATAPLTVTIILTRMHASTAGVLSDGPSPDVIFSLIREPWHSAPFASRYEFVVNWLPGYLLAAAMFAGCITIIRTTSDPKQRSFAIWVSLLIAYLFLALVPAFIERHTGAVGKFYPFRPASLILLLWLALAIAWVNGLATRYLPAIKLLCLALLVPSLFSSVLMRALHDTNAPRTFGADKQAVAEYLAKTTTPDAVVVIDPAVELSFLDFERRTGRPALVLWKFAPTNDPDLREWFRRIQFREALFSQGCGPNPAHRTDFLLATPATVPVLSPKCGSVVLETPHWRLVRRDNPGN
jgi:hypothetical protein